AWLAVGRKVYLEVRSLLPDTTPLDAYRGVNVPTLILSAERSTTAARRVAALLASAIPNARHEELAGTMHMAPLFEANRVNALIGAHVRAND
ncbi:MAG TPA: alpha/beta hydrolase, partial [Kofleriaceae bacterium]